MRKLILVMFWELGQLFTEPTPISQVVNEVARLHYTIIVQENFLFRQSEPSSGGATNRLSVVEREHAKGTKLACK